MAALVHTAKQVQNAGPGDTPAGDVGHSTTFTPAPVEPSLPPTYGPPVWPSYHCYISDQDVIRKLRDESAPYTHKLKTTDERLAWYIRKSSPTAFVRALNKALNDREERIRVKKARKAKAEGTEGDTSSTDATPITYQNSTRSPVYRPTYSAESTYTAHQWAAAHPNPFFLDVFIRMGLNFDEPLRTAGRPQLNGLHAAVKHGAWDNAMAVTKLCRNHGWIEPFLLYEDFMRYVLPPLGENQPGAVQKEKGREEAKEKKARVDQVTPESLEEVINNEERAREERLKPYLNPNPLNEKERNYRLGVLGHPRPWISDWKARANFLFDLLRLPWEELVSRQIKLPEIELEARIGRLTPWDAFCELDQPAPKPQNNLELVLTIPEEDIRPETRRLLISEILNNGFDLTAYTGPTPDEVWNHRAAALSKHLRSDKQFIYPPAEVFTSPPSYWTMWTPVLFCVQTDNLELLKLFVEEYGMRPCIDMPEWNARAMTPLLLAIRRANIPICEYLLANGARLDYVTPIINATALHYATASGIFPMVHWVVDSWRKLGLDVNHLASQRTILGHNALHAMCFYEWVQGDFIRSRRDRFVKRGLSFMMLVSIWTRPGGGEDWADEKTIDLIREVGGGDWLEKDVLGKSVLDHVKAAIRMTPEDDLDELEDLGDILGITHHFEDLPELMEADLRKDTEEDRLWLRSEEERKFREMQEQWKQLDEAATDARRLARPDIWGVPRPPTEEFDDEADLEG